ncbi:MAG TPA: chromosomal replication initiator protein DnaA [Deltaproteobacteria bacterium]|nr:chromosomal replication initiator protein DnaA [Deltaproteobacteria bacterium]
MENITETIWKNCLVDVGRHVSEQHFATWFRPIRVCGGGDGTLELEVPNRFFLEWIKEHYQPLILDVLRKVADRDLKVCWKIKDDNRGKEEKERPRQRRSSPRRSKKTVAVEGLNPNYTFENFVIGKTNEFAHAACVAVTEHLAGRYNPLFIYGGVGLGKTHLLQAIAHSVIERIGAKKVSYYTSQNFMNEFINYVSRSKMIEFRGKFSETDLLLIDDIQFWAKKERTQEEFFHIFNTLYESHKQIIVTCDKYPKDIDGIEERLRSRFEWGLVADIQPPDEETKIAIVRKKASSLGIHLPDEVSELIASVSGSNVRELEGHLNRVVAVTSLTGKEISLANAKEALRNLIKEKKEKSLTIAEIQKAVSAFYNIKVSDIKSKRRHKTVAYPRQVAMYLSRRYGKFSFPEIGSAFGGKDHSTAIHAYKKIEKEIETNPELRGSIKTLRADLGLD